MAPNPQASNASGDENDRPRLEAPSRGGAVTPADLERLATEHEGAPPEETLRTAARLFPGRFTFATGFGVEGCVLIDLAARHGIALDLFTLDTGLLFPETYALWRRLEERYGVRIRAVKPAASVDEQAVHEGPELWRRVPDRCCELRKVRPLRAELTRFEAWASAIRRDQTPDRAGARTFEADPKFGLVKVNPLVTWSEKEIWRHVHRHEVPYNTLHDHGYPSIGCQPCTSSVAPGEDPRAGRWRGSAKTECGLHAKPTGGAS
jgi:phosphoadenosine phosphosulfate reductase